MCSLGLVEVLSDHELLIVTFAFRAVLVCMGIVTGGKTMGADTLAQFWTG